MALEFAMIGVTYYVIRESFFVGHQAKQHMRMTQKATLDDLS